MARIADIATGDMTKLTTQTDKQRQVIRMNLIRKIKTGRKLVGTALDLAGAKFVAKGFKDALWFKNSKEVFEVWASHAFITCTFNESEIDRLLGLAYNSSGPKFDQLNVIVREGSVRTFEIWGIL